MFCTRMHVCGLSSLWRFVKPGGNVGHHCGDTQEDESGMGERGTVVGASKERRGDSAEFRPQLLELSDHTSFRSRSESFIQH
mmetsp:Transcript_4114/g.15505  ORF Transcript_4114/g.15505 Transcript_4114/m.15505 type:complete len:82 (+) Transcript_4114:2982-3227(+)